MPTTKQQSVLLLRTHSCPDAALARGDCCFHRSCLDAACVEEHRHRICSGPEHLHYCCCSCQIQAPNRLTVHSNGAKQAGFRLSRQSHGKTCCCSLLRQQFPPTSRTLPSLLSLLAPCTPYLLLSSMPGRNRQLSGLILAARYSGGFLSSVWWHRPACVVGWSLPCPRCLPSSSLHPSPTFLMIHGAPYDRIFLAAPPTSPAGPEQHTAVHRERGWHAAAGNLPRVRRLQLDRHETSPSCHSRGGAFREGKRERKQREREVS